MRGSSREKSWDRSRDGSHQTIEQEIKDGIIERDVSDDHVDEERF